MDSIAERVSACLRGFNNLCNAPDIWASAASDVILHIDDADDVSLLRLKNELSRFKVWSGNIGAHRKGRRSLDHRLRDASNIRDQAVQLLQDLKESLDDAESIITGEITPWDQEPTSLGMVDDDSDDGSSFQVDPPASSELSQIFDSIVQNINCLFRLSVSIHNPSQHDRLKKASLIDTSHFEPFDVKHVRARFTTASNTITERLGRAISRRRQYFKYRELHHQKLASGLDDDDTMNRDQSTVASSLPQNLVLNEPVLLELEEDNGSDAGRPQTSYATSASNTERRKIPALPQGAEDGPFECPFCFVMIRISSRRLWKKHIFSDLCPYVCVELDCPAPDQDFPRRFQWADHVRKHHWKTWNCNLGCNKIFSSLEEIKTHLSKVHAATSDSAHLTSLLSICQQPKPENDPAECPLCKEILPNLKQYQRHVGRHQEDLALFALPQLPNDDDQSGDDNEEDEQTEEDKEEKCDSGEADVKVLPYESSNQDSVAEEDMVQKRKRGWETAAPASSIRPSSPTEEFANNPFMTSAEPDIVLTDTNISKAKKKGPVHKCNSCPKTFMRVDNLRRHQHLSHGSPTHICPIPNCDKAFHRKDRLDRHLLRHQEDAHIGRDDSARIIDSHNFDLVPPPGDDIIRLWVNGVTYPWRLPANSIRDGRVVVSQIQNHAAFLMKIPDGDGHKVRLTYNGRHLKNTDTPVRDYGVNHNSLVLAVRPDGIEIDGNLSDGTATSRGYEGDTNEKKESRKKKGKDGNQGFAAPGQTDAIRGPMKVLDDLDVEFQIKWLPLCADYIDSPPLDPKKREKEHRKLCESIMMHIMLKMDSIEPQGIFEVRTRRKELVRQVHKILRDLDTAKESSARGSEAWSF